MQLKALNSKTDFQIEKLSTALINMPIYSIFDTLPDYFKLSKYHIFHRFETLGFWKLIF